MYLMTNSADPDLKQSDLDLQFVNKGHIRVQRAYRVNSPDNNISVMSSHLSEREIMREKIEGIKEKNRFFLDSHFGSFTQKPCPGPFEVRGKGSE